MPGFLSAKQSHRNWNKVACLVILCLFTNVSAQVLNNYGYGSCPDGQYFDMAGLRCVSCDTGTNSTITNFMHCKCQTGFTKSGFNKCTSCGASSVPSSECESTVYTSCAVNTSPRRLYGFEDISGKYCLPCSYGTDVGEPCNCPATSTNVYPSFCADRTAYPDVATALTATAWTSGSQNIVSLYLKCNLARAIHLCSQAPRDRVACSQLANMCTLSLASTSLTPACTAWQNLIAATATSYSSDYDSLWKTALPQFKYSSSIVDRIRSPLNFGIVFDFDIQEPTSGAELPIYIAIFKPEGTLLSVKPLERELLLCPSTPDAAKASHSFSVEYFHSCTFDVSHFFKGGKETYLYELYIRVNDQYFDIPVAVDYLNPGKSPTDVRDLNGITFTKRFFIVDYLTGVAAKSTAYEFDRCSGKCVGDDCVPQEVRFLQKIVLFTEASDGASNVAARRPYLYLKYGSSFKSSSGTYTNPNPELSYSSVYIYSNKTFWTTWLVLLIIALVIASVIAFSRICIWAMNYPGNMPSTIPDRNSKLFKTALFVTMETFGVVLFVYLMILTLYIYIFYKWQTQFYFVLPSQTEFPESYTPFKWLFWVTFVLVLSTNFIAMFRQSVVDIYFIDWEEPRFQSKRESQTRRVRSVWRTLLVGNEYNELAEQRWVMIDFTFIFAGFFLKGLDWSSLAKNAPYINLDVTNVNENMVLRFFLDCSVMMIIGCVTYIIRRLMSRFEPTSVENLIDLCYISNISMFFLDSPFHGYYVHGCNPQKQSDANLTGIIEGLKREARKTFTDKGLNPRDSTGLQTFEVYVNAAFREDYDNALKEVQKRDQEGGEIPKKGKTKKEKETLGKPQLAGPKNNESEIGRNSVINVEADDAKERVRMLFIDLVSKAQQSPETYILDKNWQQYFFGVPPVDNFLKMQHPYFYKDPGANFKRTSLIGIDIKLLIGNSLFFYMIDFASGGLTVMALFFTFLLDRFIKYLRQEFGQDNISKKTFIDERFLI